MLVQRPANASLMAGMWELPSIRPNGNKPLMTLRHSITDTGYAVTVIAVAPESLSGIEGNSRWVAPKQWPRLPLTGLTRKILRKLSLASLSKPAESNQRCQK